MSFATYESDGLCVQGASYVVSRSCLPATVALDVKDNNI